MGAYIQETDDGSRAKYNTHNFDRLSDAATGARKFAQRQRRHRVDQVRSRSADELTIGVAMFCGWRIFS